MADYSDLIRKNIKGLLPPKPIKEMPDARRDLIPHDEVDRLAFNENCLGPSPLAVEAIRQAVENSHYYPDHNCSKLKDALSEKFDIVPGMIHVTAGGLELLYNIAQTLLEPGDETIMSRPTFMAYPVLSTLFETRTIEVEGENLRQDLLKMAEAITPRTKIIWVPNPNNPLGTHNPKEEVDAFIEAVDDRCLVVFDEAYADFVDADDYPQGLEYLIRGRRVCVLRTFSKTMGLAGLRVGYGFADPELVYHLRATQMKFSVGNLAQAGALAALNDVDHLEKGFALVKEGREFYYRELDRLKLEYYPTQTNFIFINLCRDSDEIASALKDRGFIVRAGGIFGTPEHLRVTFGSMDTNRRFIDALEDVLEESDIDTVSADCIPLTAKDLSKTAPPEIHTDGRA